MTECTTDGDCPEGQSCLDGGRSRDVCFETGTLSGTFSDIPLYADDIQQPTMSGTADVLLSIPSLGENAFSTGYGEIGRDSLPYAFIRLYPIVENRTDYSRILEFILQTSDHFTPDVEHDLDNRGLSAHFYRHQWDQQTLLRSRLSAFASDGVVTLTSVGGVGEVVSGVIEEGLVLYYEVEDCGEATEPCP